MADLPLKLCLLWISALAICLQVPPAAGQQPPQQKIKLGVSSAITGDGAAYGADVKNGILIANEKFGKDSFQLIIEDDKCTGKDAVSAAQKLINLDHVNFVIGYPCSGALLAAAPLFEKAHIVTMGTAVSAAAISQAGDYIFRTWPGDLSSAAVLYPYLASHNRILGAITEETEFAQGITQAVLAQNESGAIRIINENYLPGTTDFRTILEKLKASGADGLFLNPQSETALIPMFRQILEMRWKVPVYVNYNGGSPPFLEAFGNKADGTIFFDVPAMDQLANTNGLKLYKEFVDKYGEAKSSSLYVLTSIAGFAALSQAVLSGGDVKDYLYHHSFSDVVDNLAFDQNGDPKGISQVLKVIHGGKPAALTPNLF